MCEELEAFELERSRDGEEEEGECPPENGCRKAAVFFGTVRMVEPGDVPVVSEAMADVGVEAWLVVTPPPPLLGDARGDEDVPAVRL